MPRRGAMDTSSGWYEARNRPVATSRAQNAPRRRQVGSDSPPEASVRVAAEVPSHIRFRIVREFEETCSQRRVCPDRPPSHETRSGSVEVRQEFGTEGRILEFGDTTSVQELSKLLSEGALLCRKQGHIRDTVTANCGWENTPDHQRQQDTIWIPHLMTSLWCVRMSEETLFRGDRTPHVVQRHFWMVWRKILQFGTVRS